MARVCLGSLLLLLGLGLVPPALGAAQGSGPPEDGPAPVRPAPRPVPAPEAAPPRKPGPDPLADPVSGGDVQSEEVSARGSAPDGAGGQKGNPGAGDGAGAEVAPTLPEAPLDERVAQFTASLEPAFATWRAAGRPPGGHPLLSLGPEAEALVAAGWHEGRLWLLERAESLWREPSERSQKRRQHVAQLFQRPLSPGEVTPLGLLLAAAARDLVGPKDEDGPRYERHARALIALAQDRESSAAALVALGAVLARTAPADDGAARARAEVLLDLTRSSYGDTAAARAAAVALFGLLEDQHARALEAHWRRGESVEGQPHPTALFWPRILALSDQGVGPARWWVAVHASIGEPDPAARRELRRAVLDKLVLEHAQEPWLADAVRVADSLTGDLGVDVVRQLGERLLASSEDPGVRIWTQHALAQSYARDAADPAARTRASELLLAMRAEQPEHRLARAAESLWFQLTYLRPEAVPPDVVAVDPNGREVRLSHTRGLVTALLFWGTWSPPSVELARELVALEQRFADAPFAVLGVVTDGDRGAYERVRAELGARWVDAWQESPGGTWPTAWGVRDFPTLFLLDGEGRVRHRDLEGTQLVRAVERLLRELRPQ